MNPGRGIFASIMNNPVAMKRFHGWLTIFWFLFGIPGYYTGILSSVTFVSFLSLYALAIGHFSSWQAARVEVRQEELAAEKDAHFEKRIEKKIDKIPEKVVGEVPKVVKKKINGE